MTDSPNADPPSDRIQRRGLMLVLSSPSGAGKSTIARNLLEKDSGLELSVSVTTRPRRASEIDGVHYHFLAPREFERLRDRRIAGMGRGARQLLRLAARAGRTGHGRRPRYPVRHRLAGRASAGQEKMRADVVSIFVLPPSMAELMARLHRRAEDDEETIQKRLKNAATEIEQWRTYDYVIVNDDLDRAFGAVQAIVKAERLRRDRRPGLFDFVTGLLKKSSRPAGIRQPAEFLDRKRFRAARAVDAGSVQQRLAAERLQALAQHFAPLAEGMLRDQRKPFSVRGIGSARGSRWTTEEVTFGGGQNACGGTSNWIFAFVRHPASTPSLP
jgi:guanylate kinase